MECDGHNPTAGGEKDMHCSDVRMFNGGCYERGLCTGFASLLFRQKAHLAWRLNFALS